MRGLRQWVPSGMARGTPKISKIGWRNAPKTPPKRARRGSRKERPGWAGCGATVVVISPPDVSLTGSVYDFTRGLGFCLGPGLACRAAPGSPPPGAAPSLADPHSLYGRASRIMLNGVSVARLSGSGLEPECATRGVHTRSIFWICAIFKFATPAIYGVHPVERCCKSELRERTIAAAASRSHGPDRYQHHG